jgi:hypothetical protein
MQSKYIIRILQRIEVDYSFLFCSRLALALFHGLGIQSKIEGDKVDTVVLSKYISP